MERDFKGVFIPKEVWLDKRLTAVEKSVFAEINSLDGEDGCVASNDYLAKFCQCSERLVSQAVSKLVKIGFVEVESFDGRTRVLRTSLAYRARQSSRICEAASQNLRPEINSLDIKERNTLSGVSKEKPRKRFVPPSVEEVKAYCEARMNSVSADRFVAFYESKGWMVGKNKMKDWKAAVRTWEMSQERNAPKSASSKNFTERKYTDDEYNEIFKDLHDFDDMEV